MMNKKQSTIVTVALAIITMATLTATIMTMMQQAHAQPSNTGSNTGVCTQTGSVPGSGTLNQSCNIHQGMCQLAQQGQTTIGIINNSECS